MLHRLLEQYLDKNQNNNNNPAATEKQCEHCSAREIVAQKAERESIKYKQAEYLSDKIGKIFDGVVTSVADYGLFIEIKENKCTGLVRTSEISMEETYTIDSTKYIATSESGDVIRLGDEVRVAIKAVDMERKTIDLMIVRL
jgi:ribonuclease R